VRAALLICLSLTACLRAPSDKDAPKPSALPPAPSIVLDAEGALPPELAQVPEWQLAGGGDPMHLAVLARAVGARGLARRIEAGGTAGWIALGAYAHAPDAFEQREQLCRLVLRIRPPARVRALGALERSLSMASALGEELAPGASASCARSLHAAAGEPLSAQEQDLLSVIDVRLGQATTSAGLRH
jgi:hypothetical protein